ncbi:MAG: C4-type zinc ribbon domain-containing protein [Deltaproteobacteria bacterium]|nr:C4-type zinc ribbon domain-containing protein [Deltaproteobacteria bacterium]
MREHLAKLVDLQTVDGKIHEMERLKEVVPQRISLLEETMRKEEEKVRLDRTEIEKLQKERRKKEKELDEEIEKVKKTETRVFEIKTNKEYQAVLKEIEGTKKLNHQREEEILEILERYEERHKNLLKDEKELEIRKKEGEQQIQELKQQAESFAREMAQELKRREEKGKGIPSEILSRYNMLLGKRQGIAVARVIDGVCQACFMNLRPQLYIELQRQDSFILCPNCSRILFYDNGVPKAQKT